MKTNKKTIMQGPISNQFDFLTEEIIFTILDYLNNDPFAKKKTLKPLRAELLSRALHRYPHIEYPEQTLCPRIEDSMLNVVSLSSKDVLCSINLSRSRFFLLILGWRFGFKLFQFVEIDLSNGVELNDLTTAAIAEAKNLERLWLARCKLINDMGIGCITAWCGKLRLFCLKWCFKTLNMSNSQNISHVSLSSLINDAENLLEPTMINLSYSSVAFGIGQHESPAEHDYATLERLDSKCLGIEFSTCSSFYYEPDKNTSSNKLKSWC
ncbi:hypothetical protein SADUNF_Sadunf13G0119200 [Salix dunnii]|uniref:Uncharacterized protein n=1 Tax=Salix dunnii TaxID=1413687 RepID=A0A835JM28_9ROSI|nr:hypothetical protein SADUNF_Sadunf13G0119200 [Salix dunnii]